MDIPTVGEVHLPRPEQLAYYVGLAALAAAEIIDWPVALAVGVGHALAYRHHDRVAQELGEAFDEGRAAQRVGEALAEDGLPQEVLEALPEPPA